jgi:streptomycin 6-kinase
MKFPSIFIANIQNAFGEKGKSFLTDLPQLIETASRQWDLTEVFPVPELSYNFVAFAKRAESDVVLKIGVPDRELKSEVLALRLFGGDGAVRLLEFDEDRFMFLLERLRPGKMLTAIEDDEQRTSIAANVMSRLWRNAPDDLPFIKLTKWFDGLKGLRPMFNGGTGPFPEKIVARVEETLPRLFAESSPPRLIHGDLHHFNILSSQRGYSAGVVSAALRSGGTPPPRWIAIDPKGVIGHPEYEVGPLLINPMPDFLNGTNPKAQTERRLSILAERLGFPRGRLLDWALCHAILSAWWDTRPDGSGGEYSIRCAELFASL